jgi:lysophospholipase L1-like esterase
MNYPFRNFFIKIAAFFIGILVCFVGAEIIVRVLVDDGMEYNLEMWKYARKLKQVAKNSSQGHLHIPNKSALLMGVDVSINSHGYRNRETPIKKPPGVTRVMMLGDSLTFGWGVPAEDTVSTQLENLLVKNNHQFEVINTGIGNTNAEMQISSFLVQGIQFSPDIVVLNYFINDAEPIPRPTKNILMKYSPAYVFFALRLGSISRLFLGGKQWEEYYLDLYDENFEGWKRTKSSISKLAKYCAKNGIKLIIVSYPELHKLNPYPFKSVNKKLGRIAVNLQVPFLNLVPTLQNEQENSLWVSIQDQHPNSLACKLIAPAIKDALEKNFSIFSTNRSSTVSELSTEKN